MATLRRCLVRLGAPDSKSYPAKTSRVPIEGGQPDTRFALVRYARRNPLFGKGECQPCAWYHAHDSFPLTQVLISRTLVVTS